jgi:hypothetical protein
MIPKPPDNQQPAMETNQIERSAPSRRGARTGTRRYCRWTNPSCCVGVWYYGFDVFGRRNGNKTSENITPIPWADEPPGAERIASWRVDKPDGSAALDFGWRADTDLALNSLRNEILSWPDK